MAFLDNSGDIILDAVLTDAGRARLARGDGSFRIVKFALGDDEINYGSYQKNHSKGSAYYDLEILQTPVLEAFTNNTSTMKNKLLSIPRNNLLYLPIVKMNNGSFKTETATNTPTSMYLVATDSNSETYMKNNSITGVIRGATLDGAGNYARLDQGLDTSELSQASTLDADLVETQYIVQMDNRLGSLVDINGNPTPVSFIDDDHIATYYLTNANSNYVQQMTKDNINAPETTDPTKAIAGPLGTMLQFKVKASVDLQTNTFLFTRLGKDLTSGAVLSEKAGSTGYYIDTQIKVTGGTTGYSIDVPVRFVKITATS